MNMEKLTDLKIKTRLCSYTGFDLPCTFGWLFNYQKADDKIFRLQIFEKC